MGYIGKDVIILADGATDKTGVVYPSGKTGGRLLAEIATDTAKDSTSSGYGLADEVTDAIRRFYQEQIPAALDDASKRAATTLAVGRVVGGTLTVTQIGDTNIRLHFMDGTQRVLTNDKLIDTENASRRAEYIQQQIARFESEHGREPGKEERTALVASGRSVIQERLNTQYRFQNNNSDTVHGYGTIDGTLIPREFTNGEPTSYVKEYEFDADEVTLIELVSDGFYGEFPDGSSVEDYRGLYTRIHEEDPDKYRKYPSTKPLDDATVVSAKLYK